MRGFAPQLKISRGIAIELRSCRSELTDPVRAFLDQYFHGRSVTQRGTCGKRVDPVQLRRVTSAQRGGYATLRVRRRAIEERALGENDNLTRIGRAPRGVQACDSAPDHEETCANALWHARKIATRAIRRSSDDVRAPALCPASRIPLYHGGPIPLEQAMKPGPKSKPKSNLKSNRTLFRAMFAVAVILTVGAQHGCSDTPTAPAATTSTRASDAINAPGDDGAPETIFLAPLGPKRTPRGILDTTLVPSVAICRLVGDACAAADTLAHFVYDSTADSTRRIELNERAYHFRWKVKDLPADPAVAYRVVVTLGDTTAGFTDLKIVASDYLPPASDTARFAFITDRNWLNVRFQIFVPPVTLTVISEPGVHGDLTSQTYSYRRGDRIPYNFYVDSGYRNMLVTLDQNPIPGRGRVLMDDSHVLIASADRDTGVASGDEWILRDARALLRANDKITSAQNLLSKLDEMQDTVNIIERLRRVEMTLLQRATDATAMPALDAALAGHSFDAGSGAGSDDGAPGNGGDDGGGIVTASALLVPLGIPARPQLRPSASIMAPASSGAEPVTIAYVNGILTTPLGALFAAHHIAVAAREAHWYVNAPFEVKLLYNRSAMASESTTEDRCILELGIKGDWLGINSLPDEVARCINSTRPRALALLADYAEVGQQFSSVLDRSIVTRPADVDTIAAITTRLRDAGRHVVFVMHSQGNLVVQQAVTLLARQGKYSQARDTTCIGGVALASPTSEAWPISARHLNGLVVDGDAILLLGHNKFPRVQTPLSDSAASVMSGSIRARIVSIATAARLRWGVRLHGIIESYLMQQPMRDRIEDAIVASYKGCALGRVAIAPSETHLRTGETGTLGATLLDMTGNPLDGRRGLAWYAESQSDWQRAVLVSPEGVATGRYVGGTTVSAITRNVVGTAGVTVDPAVLQVSATETLSAQWVFVWPPTLGDQFPIPDFAIPPTSWGGGSCAEYTVLKSNGREGTASKQCTADYHVTIGEFAGAGKYVGTFFQKNSTAPLVSVSGTSASLHRSITGPSPNVDLLPGPILIDRIGVTALDFAGHLLASGNACVHGCAGWPNLKP
jgi:hypothetical protein